MRAAKSERKRFLDYSNRQALFTIKCVRYNIQFLSKAIYQAINVCRKFKKKKLWNEIKVF